MEAQGYVLGVRIKQTITHNGKQWATKNPRNMGAFVLLAVCRCLLLWFLCLYLCSMQNGKYIKSKRAFVVYTSDTLNAPEVKSLDDIINDSIFKDYEYAHSLMQIIDDVMDLCVDETLYFLYNRDNSNSRSILKRIQ